MEKLTGYANPFHGNGEIDIPERSAPASRWFFIKAGAGNTSPAAMLPFGAMSVSPYTGGYPTGYGDNLVNTHSRPAKFKEGKRLKGFAHIQQSGTGAIGYYYNYCLVSPSYYGSEERSDILSEKAEPGYYACEIEDISCELTASSRVAFHRYVFRKPGGFVKLDFTNNGLDLPGNDRKKAEIISLKRTDANTLVSHIKAEGISLYFAAKANGSAFVNGERALFMVNENKFTMRIAVSLESAENALGYLDEELSFDEAREKAENIWENELGRIKISTPDENVMRIFYSNLYHSVVKPADWSGESLFVPNKEKFVTDFATLWDIYKTQLPLIYMTNRQMSEKIVETLLGLGETFGSIPNSTGLTDDFITHGGQARLLGIYALVTAMHFGISVDRERFLKVAESDIFDPGKQEFIRDGKCDSLTWCLDMADACGITAKTAEECGRTDLCEKLKPLSQRWIECYDKNTGLLRADSSYYEGTLYNYSFRQMLDMDGRIALAGGKEDFVKLLDDFFGYNGEDTVLPTDPKNYKPVEEGMKLGRFEGFNNESDTEAPYSYIYAGRQDRTCEVVRSGMKYMFGYGKGGIPGNNDSGALSSYYVFAALGLFPVAGQDLFLLGSPFVDSAEIELSNGRRLVVRTNDREKTYINEIHFNGRKIEDFRIPVSELMQGGELVFTK